MKRITSRPIRVGLVGCGNVSRRYLEHVAEFDELDVVACADAMPANAAAVGQEFGIPALGVDELIGDVTIDLVLNLTIPRSHAEVTMRALRAGKHVYTEKPLAADLSDARAIMALADELGLFVGCAPDTFMGAGITASRALIDEGAIGEPVSANAFMMTPGPEQFHPGPDFLYREGAGPLFDGGPYYVSALVSLLGPVARVGAVSTTGRTDRTVLVGDRAGERFPVETSTHVAGVLQFVHGAVGSLITSFDVIETSAPRLEVHGTEGSIIAPAPNSWGGPAWVRRAGEQEFMEVPIAADGAGFMGMGLVDMARGLQLGREPRASGARGLHVLEVLTGIDRSASCGGQFYDMTRVDDDVVALFGRNAR